jgi:hypothetical protein
VAWQFFEFRDISLRFSLRLYFVKKGVNSYLILREIINYILQLALHYEKLFSNLETVGEIFTEIPDSSFLGRLHAQKITCSRPHTTVHYYYRIHTKNYFYLKSIDSSK